MLKGSERNGSVLVAHHSHSLVSIPSTLPSTAATAAAATPPLPRTAASTASRALTAAAIPIARVISTATAVAAGASTTS